MHWTYDELMALPADLYDELYAWLNESHPVLDEE
jgi:hypothetical protein